MSKKHIVEIPELYLIHIAASGKMGTGELLALMRIWAEKECERLGLMPKLREEQKAILKKSHEHLSNALGKENMQKIDTAIEETAQKLHHNTMSFPLSRA
jgi:hypothetical protein